MTSDDLESELRNALRRKEPSRSLMPDVPARKARSWWPMAMAAAIAIAVTGGEAYRLNEQRQEQLRAKDQLVFALRLTAVKLHRTKTQIQTIRSERLQ